MRSPIIALPIIAMPRALGGRALQLWLWWVAACAHGLRIVFRVFSKDTHMFVV